MFGGSLLVRSNSLTLDSSGIFAAYSLRDLLNNNQPVIRARRVSDSLEQDFTSIEIMDGTITGWASGASVQACIWYDQMGGGKHVQSTTPPLILSNGNLILVNNKPSLLFSNSKLESSIAYPLRISDGFGCFAVYKKGDVSTSDSFTSINPQYIVGLITDAIIDSSVFLRILGGKLDVTRPNEAGAGYITTRHDTHVIGQQHRLSSVVGGESLSLFNQGLAVSGYQFNESKVSFYGTSFIRIGYERLDSRFFSGNMQEILLYRTDKTGNRLNIENNINNYYSIY